MERWQDIGQVQALASLLASLPPELGWPKMLVAVVVFALIGKYFGVVGALVALVLALIYWALNEGLKRLGADRLRSKDLLADCREHPHSD